MKAPDLSSILEHPDLVREIPPEAVPALLAELAAIQTRLAARLAEAHANPKGDGRSQAEGDCLLTVDEAARKLGVSKDYLYRHKDRFPFAVRIGQRVRFSQHGIERYIRQRAGR